MGSNLSQNALTGWHWSTITRTYHEYQSVTIISNKNIIDKVACSPTSITVHTRMSENRIINGHLILRSALKIRQ